MRFQNVYIDTIAYHLPDTRVSTRELESQLQALYQKLRIPMGQLEVMTGIKERRWWPDPFQVSTGAIEAGKKALNTLGMSASKLDVLIYAGVCRDFIEPATACRIAHELGMPAHGMIFDLSNACLGVLNAIIEIANRIELGQARHGMVVACESAGPITQKTIDQLLQDQNLDQFKYSLATLTGGSGAVAIILSAKGDQSSTAHRLVGGTARMAPEHHRLCQWGLESKANGYEPYIRTDAVQVLQHGVQLGASTWQAFLHQLQWSPMDVDRIAMHQVGKSHQTSILKALGIPIEKDYVTYSYLGNMGTVSLPLTAAKIAEDKLIHSGQKMAWLGIGSGLNCLMLGVEW